MDKIQALYQSYLDSGIISPSTTLEQFATANEEQLSTLYNQGIESNIISSETNIDLFTSAWGLKKKRNEEAPDTVSESGIGFSELPTGEKDTLLERTFGKNHVTDFFGDIYRAGVQGLAQGATVDDALKIFYEGEDVDQEDLEDYIAAVQKMESFQPSDEMKEFDEIYRKEGGGLMGFIKGVGKTRLQVIPQIFTSSMFAMLNKGSLAAGATGAATGGLATAPLGGIGAIPGAIAGLSGALETGVSFTEFLKEELGDKDFNDENIRAVLEDPAALSRIKNRALTRGISIAAIDAITGGVATKLGTSAGKSFGKLGTIAASGITEAVGGGVGEAAARGLAGQEMDVAEIGFEAVAGTATAPLTVGRALYKIPRYKIGDVRVTKEKLIETLENSTPDQLLSTKLSIKNDKELSALKDEAWQDATIKRNTLEVLPNISEEQLNEIVRLTKRKEFLEANQSEVSKVELKSINNQIKEITDAVQKPSTEEVDVQEQARDGKEVGVRDTTRDITTEITPEAVETAEVSEEEVTELTEEQKDEVKDLEYIIGTPEGQKPKFRLSEEESVVEDTEAIEDTMNQFDEQELNFTPTETTEQKAPVNPVAESKSTTKAKDSVVNKLLKKIQEFNGIPMLTGITDMLAAGVIEDSQGNPMEVEGGVLYNVLGKNKNLAWANVTEETAQKQYDNALELYNNNKELFDRLWADGTLPNGHVPMAIMRMGDSALHSNEAVFRYVLPSLNAVPQANNQKALDTFVDTLSKSKKDRKKVDALLKAIKDNNITGLNELFDFIVKDANARAQGDINNTLSLDTRSLVYDVIFSKPGVKTNNSQVVKDLFEGVESKNELFLSDTIYEAIGEPSVKNARQGEVMSIVGIDVLTGGVEKTQHPNYGYGPKGQAIALISNPVHGIEVFPEWKAKSNRVFKKTKPKTKTAKEKGAKFPSERQVEQQTMGAFATDKAFVGAKVKAGEMSDVDNLIGMLRLAFPGVNVATTQEEFDAILETPGVRTRETKGKTILGITIDGKIYLNPDSTSLATPIHEFGHIWLDYLRSDASGKKGTAILNQGLKLIEGTDALKKAIDKYGNNELAREEALVELIGTKGDTIANSAKRSKFKEWLNGLFKYVKEMFTRSKDIKKEDVKNLTLEDFINVGLADLFAGELINGKFDAKTAESSAKARFELLESIGGPELSMQEIIETGRAEGFSDAAIKAVLQGRGFKAADINPAMELALKKGETLPAAFQQIEGGAERGLKLFRDVQTKLKRYKNTKNPKTKEKPTSAQVREKALSLLRNTEVYKSLPEITQDALVLALDKSVDTRANASVQKEITRIKNAVKGYKKGVRDLRKAQIQIKNFIRNVLPVSQGYSQSVVNNLISNVTAITAAKDLPVTVEKVLKKVDAERARQKKRLIKDIITFVNQKSKGRKTRSNKSRAGSLDSQGKDFFTAIKNVFKSTPEELEAKRGELAAKSAEIDELTLKETRGEKLTIQENKLLDESLAFDLFSNLENQSIEDIQSLFEDLKAGAKESIKRLNQRKAAQAERAAQISNDFDSQIKGDFESIVNEDGSIKDVNQRRQDKERILQNFREGKIFEGTKAYVKYFGAQLTTKPFEFVRSWFGHLGSITEILDRYKPGAFKKYLYDDINVMEENSLRGKFQQRDVIDNIANTIKGIEGGFKEILSKFNKLRVEIIVDGKREFYSDDELLRIYALSLNEVQRQKLNNQGFNDKVLSDIESKLDKDLIEFANKVVEYFSTTYYESVNDVYSSVNNINLGYVENYFPTRTVSKEVNKTWLNEQAFVRIFDAETSPAFRERTDKTNPIELSPFLTFTNVMNEHIESMEKYKAFAQGVRDLNTIMNTESVDAVLQELGSFKVVSESLNHILNPDYGLKEAQGIYGGLFNAFTGYALGFKLIQIPKQATSFVNAFEEYQYIKGKNTPGLDHVAFMVESLATLFSLFTKDSAYKKAYEKSATFRERVLKGLEGDIYGLESGGRLGLKSEKKRKEFIKLFRKAKGAPTVIGDILGVLGYMTNYNRNIKNGMSESEALKAFNNYNATQQSRRGADKIRLQRNTNVIFRTVTMFGSTAFLQMNKAATGLSALFKRVSQGDIKGAVVSKEARALALNLGVANLLFILAANMAKYAFGDDEDKEEVSQRMLDSAIGLNLIYQLPISGDAMEALVRASRGERIRAGGGVNPLLTIMKEINKELGEPGIAKFKPALELTLGTRLDPFAGLTNMIKDGEIKEEDILDIIGISSSYRPNPDKPMSKSDLKKYFPDLYEQMYGKDSAYGKMQEEIRNIKKSLKK